ncbi:MAG: glycosyltransferase [Rubrivivax sp.]|nr:glycosyltransferase [Rubrivivax sp.]
MNVLLVTYYYPPLGGAGVQRALKFSKYLGDFGVRASVLAADNRDYVHDESLLAEVPDALAVRRVEHRPWLQRFMAWRKRGAAAAAPKSAPKSAPAPRLADGGTSASPGLRDAALRAYAAMHFPDDRAGWARRAYAEGQALIREQGIALVLSTAPPMSAHWLGMRLARDAGLPWVADYRDLWTDNPGYAAPAWRAALDRRAETGWLRQAAGVVTVTPSWRERFVQRLAAGSPVTFIPNGYDEADFAAAEPVPRDDGVFRLVHTGTFYGPRDPATLLAGIDLYLRRAAPTARPLRLRLVGNMGARFAQSVQQFEAQHPGVIELRAYVPHFEAIAEMRAADALLLVVGAGPGGRASEVVAGTLPGKIFEYLRAARPVLLLGDERGDAAEILRRHGQGRVADETRPEAIAAALQAMVDAAPRAPGAAPAPAAGVERFERRALTGELARFLVNCREAWRG